MSNFHDCKIADFYYRTHSSSKGLKETECKVRLQKYGHNKIKPPKRNYLKKFISYFFGGFCWILWIAAFFVFLSWKPFGDPPSITNLAMSILLVFVIFIQAGFSAYQDYTSSKIMQSIESLLPKLATVIRDEKEKIVSVHDIVIGDLVKLKYGNKVPADVRLIKLNGLKLDNSILTGESLVTEATIDSTNINLHESRNVAFMGTLVTEGEAFGIVFAVGDETVMGRIASLTSNTESKPTLLQLEIQRFVLLIAFLALTTGGICMLIWTFWLRKAHPGFLSLSQMLATNLGGVIVAFVPNGLPVAVTLVLSIIAKRMYKQRVLVKNLNTVETLGAVNILCSDKTGTLTMNQMVVVRIASFDHEVEIGKIDDAYLNAKNDIALELLKISVMYNNDSYFDEEDHEKPLLIRRVNGNATDNALLRFAYSSLNIENPTCRFSKLKSIPFNSKTKRMVTIVRPEPDSFNIFSPNTSSATLIIKGAPDYIFQNCTKFLSQDVDGKSLICPLTNQDLQKYLSLQESWSKTGHRVLLVAYRLLDSTTDYSIMNEDDIDQLVSDLVIVGCIGIMDPPRTESYEVVQQCKNAGIRLFMVTGDFPSTASSIAIQIGIFSQERTHSFENVCTSEMVPLDTPLLLSGTDLPRMNDSHWGKVVQYKEIVFARTSRILLF